MAAVGQNYLTLVERAKRLGSGKDAGKVMTVAELLSETNDIIADIPYVDANEGTTHKIGMRVGLPTTYWKQMNKGTPSSLSRVVQQKEGTAVLKTVGVADVDMPDVNSLRSDEMVASMSALSNDMATEAIYGTAADQEGLVGLAHRYSDVTAGNGQNIIKMGGVGADNTSIWLIGFGRRAIFGALPKGFGAGIKHTDYGVQPERDADGNTFMAHRDEYSFASGLCVQDWRYAVRLCNIDVSAALADPDGSTVAIINNMIKAMHRVPSLTTAGVKFGFYMNRDMMTALDIQGTNKSNAYFTSSEVEGVTRTKFRGIPLRLCDAILSSEDLVA